MVKEKKITCADLAPDEPSPDFLDFLDIIGEKTRLKGFQGFSGGLDVKTDVHGVFISFFQIYLDLLTPQVNILIQLFMKQTESCSTSDLSSRAFQEILPGKDTSVTTLWLSSSEILMTMPIKLTSELSSHNSTVRHM